MTRTIDFPCEWATGAPIDSQTFRNPDHPGVTLFGTILDDGANLWVLVYPGGQRFARCAGQTGWSLEERFEGSSPAPKDAATVDWLWSTLIGISVDAGRGTRRLAAALEAGGADATS